MADSYLQTDRVGELTTPAPETLVLKRFEGTEGISELFEFRIEALTEGVDPAKLNIDFSSSIGKNCTVKVETIGHGDRFFVGVLAETSLIDYSAEGATYSLVLRPWLWLLSHRVNSRIFHNKTVVEIISKVFDEDHSGYAKYEPPGGSFPTIEYCVQHNESDLDFVLRLLQEHGIHFHFRFTDGDHKLIMGDMNSSFPGAPGGSREFLAQDARHTREEERFFTWVGRRRFTTGSVVVTDYDLHKPTDNLKGEGTSDAPFETQLESFWHPYAQALGENVSRAEGDKFAKHRIKSLRAADGRFHATGDCASLAAGMIVGLAKHPSDDGEYLVVRATHTMAVQQYRSGGAIEGEPYSGTYELLKSDTEFAPPATVKAPRISGVQTATVLGKGEIDVDKYGRIEVCFNWMREKPGGWSNSDENLRSMRVRVAQVWAGKKWGAMFIPRRGMEVLVTFIDGDPDTPVVIGCVYNKENMPPYELEGQKNIAGWKSDSTEGSGGYNEFVMNDTKGKELVTFHAQKDLDSTVLNDETRTIKHDRTTKITNDDTLLVDHDIMIEAKNQITLKVGSSKITMTQAGITIEALMIDIKATANLTTKGTALAKHESGGMMVISAPIVTIN